LYALSKLGTELFLMHGNRDFLIGETFAKACGATLLNDPSTLSCAQGNVLLMHGDSLCSHDERYMKFRATIRNPAFLSSFLQRPIEDRRTTANQLRAMSRQHNRQRPADIMDINPDEVPRAMRAAQVRRLIHGHTHRPAIHRFELDREPAARIVLGDWDQKAWFVRQSDDGEIALCHFPLSGSLDDTTIQDRLR
jgi:UDP-2,3-diacylglucosamine hydrolase